MTVFYENTTKTKLYLYVDITFGATSVLVFFFSLSLNTIIILFYKRRSTNNAILYKILAVTNIVSTSFHCPMMAYNFLKPITAPYSVHVVSVVICYITIVGLSLGGWLVTVISGLRLYTLKYPLQIIPKRWCYMLIGGTICIANINGGLLFKEARTPTGGVYFSQRKQFIFDMETEASVRPETIIHRLLFFINMIMCLALCVATSHLLCPRFAFKSGVDLGAVKERREKLRHSTMTIFRLNVIYTVTLVYMIVVLVLVYTLPSTTISTSGFLMISFVAFPLFPLSLSITNPFVIISRSGDIRRFARYKLFAKEEQPNPSGSVSFANCINGTSRNNPKLSRS